MDAGRVYAHAACAHFQPRFLFWLLSIWWGRLPFIVCARPCHHPPQLLGVAFIPAAAAAAGGRAARSNQCTICFGGNFLFSLFHRDEVTSVARPAILVILAILEANPFHGLPPTPPPPTLWVV